MKLFAMVIYVVCHATLTPAKELAATNKVILPYYHELSMTKFKPPDIRRNDSYFGFSITYDNYCKSLVISSPRYDETGSVFDCGIDNQTCSPITANINRERSDTYTHDFWFGATVRAGPDYIVTCAPRYTEDYTVKRGKSKSSKTGTFAHCYSRDKNSKHFNLKFNIADEKRINDFFDKPNAESGKMKVERFMDSFGWSIDVLNLETSSAVLVGGPAMYTGRVMVYDNINKTPKLLIRKENNFPEFNFGYSVASGNFFKNNEWIYAVGSTYGEEGAGSVHFFSTNRILLSKLDKSFEKEVIVGSMFGAVLCAGKFNQNGLTNLLVGAPTFAIDHGLNRGAVYVYLANSTLKHNMQYHTTISNGKDGSYFGSAIVNLGDLNGDKSEEIAIAAPYEDEGRGAVYLYSGAEIISNAKTVPYMQRIQPEHFRSFGMSMAALHDYDENGCNELAVGAPYDDVVLLYKCMATITVTLDTTFPNVQNRTRENRTNFMYQVCFIVDYPAKPQEIIADLSTRVEVTHPSAKLTNPGEDGAYTFNTSLTEWRRTTGLPCHLVGFTLPPDGNYESKISFTVTTQLLNNPFNLKQFDRSRVVLSERSKLTILDPLWAAECSGNKECLPNLTFKFVDKTAKPYSIGSSEREEFSVSVSNTGDIAYDSLVLVRVFGAAVHGSSQQCVPPKPADMIPPAPGADDLLCTPKFPIQTNHTWNSDAIVMNMIHLTNKDRVIKIQALLFNHRTEINKSNQTYEHFIYLKSDPSVITIKGISNIGEVVNMTRKELEIGKVMEHKYTVKNTGKAKWVDVTYDVILEKTPCITYLNTGVSDNKRTYECMPTVQTSTNLQASCKVPLIGQDSINLAILMQVMTENTADFPEEGITAKSTIRLHLDDTIKTESVTTLIQVHDAVVPWWVILIAILIALFILFIIAFILYECGFLRREKKKELQNLRKSIRRQTMRLSTVVTEDQRQVLELVEEEHDGTQHVDNKAFTGTEDAQPPEKENNGVCATKH